VFTPFPARRQAKPNGVVETLSAGYAAINHQLWILLIPIALDVFLWLGPHVSYSPLVDPALARGSAWVRQIGAVSRRAPSSPELNANGNPNGSVSVDDVRQSLMSLATDTNVLSLLARGPLTLPSVAVLLGGIGALSFVTSWGEGVALLVGSLLGSLLIGGFFYAAIAQQVRGAGTNPVAAGLSVPRSLARVLGLLLVLLGLGLLLGLPVLVVVGVMALVAPVLAAFGMALAIVALLLVDMYLYFALNAIFVSRVGPLAAVQRSVAVVRKHLWPTVALALLSWVILAGMDRVWELLAANVQAPFGVALGMLGNAYIASGLIAASMIFYHERADPGVGSLLAAGVAAG